MKSTAFAALVAVSVLALSGCSGDSGEPGDDPSSEAAGSPSEDASTEPGIITPTDVPPAPTNRDFSNKPQGIFTDVTVENCDLENGDVTANGTATNSGKFARDLVVTISWSVASTSDVVARAIATMDDVEPGDTVDWDVETTLDSPQPVGCVTTALAGQLK